jgi:hypothetical protein
MGEGDLRWRLALAARTAEALAARYPDDRGAQHLVHLLRSLEEGLDDGLAAAKTTVRPARPKPAAHPLRFVVPPAGEGEGWESLLK